MIRMVIESRLENVSLIGGAVRGIAEGLSIDSMGSYHLELCVVEAVTNVIKHAYHLEAEHSVELEILIQPDRLTFKVSDSGDSMDISKISSLQFDPSKVKTLPERGMGTFILKSLMDEIGYEIVKGRNVLTMSKSIKTRAPSA